MINMYFKNCYFYTSVRKVSFYKESLERQVGFECLFHGNKAFLDGKFSSKITFPLLQNVGKYQLKTLIHHVLVNNSKRKLPDAKSVSRPNSISLQPSADLVSC